MTKLAFSDRDRRALGVGMALWLCVIVAWSTPKLIAWQADVVTRATGVHDEQSALPLNVLRRSALELEQRRRETESSFLHSTSPAGAAATLSALIAPLADSSNFQVDGLRSRSRAWQGAGGVVASVALTGTGDVSAFASLLNALDASRHHLVVRTLSVVPADVFASDDVPERLRVEMTIETVVLLAADKEGPRS